MDKGAVVREQPPAHYTLRIESLSSLRTSLAKRKDRRISSQEFTASGHKWMLTVNLNGNQHGAEDEHISMYLKLVDRLKPGEVVNAVFSFFVYNQQLDKYFTKQDMTVKRFSQLKTEWGIPKVLYLSTFNDPMKGYVVDDCCVFGTEVFVIENKSHLGTLSLIEANVKRQYSWRVSQYSKLNDEFCDSPVFTFDGISWILTVYPRGDSREKNKSISIYLRLDDDKNLSSSGGKIFVEYEITIKDQLGSNDKRILGAAWFEADVEAGYSAFLSLSDLKDPSKGYLLKDQLIVEVIVKNMFWLRNA